MQKTITLVSKDENTNDTAHWLSKTPSERLAALEFLRRQMYDDYSEQIQRVYRIIERE